MLPRCELWGSTAGIKLASVRSVRGQHVRLGQARGHRVALLAFERARPQQPDELRARPGHRQAIAFERHHAGAKSAAMRSDNASARRVHASSPDSSASARSAA